MEIYSLFPLNEEVTSDIWKSKISKYRVLNPNVIVFDEPLKYIVLVDEECGFDILLFHRETHDFISWYGNWGKIEPVGKDRGIFIVDKSQTSNPHSEKVLKGLWSYTGKMLSDCTYTYLAEETIEGERVIKGIQYSKDDAYEDIFDYETGILLIHGQYPLKRIKVSGKCFLYSTNNDLHTLYTLKGEGIFRLSGVKGIKIDGNTLLFWQKGLLPFTPPIKVNLSKYI